MTLLETAPLALLLVAIALGLRLRRRYRAELQAHERTEQELRETQSRLQQITQAVDQATDAVGIGDMEGTSLYHNAAHIRLFGYTVDELNATAAGGVLFADKVVAREIHSSIRAGRSWRGETDILTKDGRRVPTFVRADCILDPAGQPIGIFGVFTDITRERQIAGELERAKRLESLGLLAGGIAHDFNNLLAMMMLQVDLASSVPGTPPPVTQRLTELDAVIARSKRLTQQLMDFAKTGALEKKRVDLGPLLHESVGLALPGSEVECTYTLAEDLAPVEVDETQFAQVVHNIALNAVQAMNQRGLLRVRAANVAPNAEPPPVPAEVALVKVSLTDTGPGIPPEHLARIFDPLFTTKKTGTGLGLATAYTVMKRHGGLLTVETTLGMGTTFHLYLPAAPRARAAGAVSSALRPRVGFAAEEQTQAVEAHQHGAALVGEHAHGQRHQTQ
jgi:PAS domain S-box-containing protein